MIARLHEQMRVIALERVVDEAEITPVTARDKCPFDFLYQARAAKRGYVLSNAKSHVTGEVLRDAFSRPVSDARIRPGSASTSVSSPVSIELELSSHKCVC